MIAHCFLYAWGIRLVTVEIFHTSVNSARTTPDTGVVDFEIASLRLRFEKKKNADTEKHGLTVFFVSL